MKEEKIVTKRSGLFFVPVSANGDVENGFSRAVFHILDGNSLMETGTMPEAQEDCTRENDQSEERHNGLMKMESGSDN